MANAPVRRYHPCSGQGRALVMRPFQVQQSRCWESVLRPLELPKTCGTGYVLAAGIGTISLAMRVNTIDRCPAGMLSIAERAR